MKKSNPWYILIENKNGHSVLAYNGIPDTTAYGLLKQYPSIRIPYRHETIGYKIHGVYGRPEYALYWCNYYNTGGYAANGAAMPEHVYNSKTST